MNSPDNPQFEAQLHLGALLLEEGRFADALSCLEELAQKYPQMAAAHYFKGLALGNLERHEEAAQAFKNALDLAPASLPILFNFAVSCLHTQRWQAALLALTRYVNYNPNNEEYRAYLLLGVAAAEACEFGEPLTFSSFLNYEQTQQTGDKYSIDLHAPVPSALLALCFSALGAPEDIAQMLAVLRESDAALFARVQDILPNVLAWAEQNPVDELPGEPQVEPEVEPHVETQPQSKLQSKPSADFDWEASNDSLRQNLARFTRFADEGEEAPAEAIEELLFALGDAYLLVPTEGEIEQEGDAPTFSIMLRPHTAFNDDLVGVVFTGVTEARAFFGAGHTLHRIVMPGIALAGLVAELNATLAESEQVIAAIIINPAGPHPYILQGQELMKLTK